MTLLLSLLSLLTSARELPFVRDSIQSLLIIATKDDEKYYHHLELARLYLDLDPGKVKLYADSAAFYAQRAGLHPATITNINAHAGMVLGDIMHARELADKSYKTAVASNDTAAQMYAQFILASVSLDTLTARNQLRKLVTYYRLKRNYVMRGHIFLSLGNGFLPTNPDSAASHYYQAITYYQLANNLTGVAKCKWMLGTCYSLQQKYFYSYKSRQQALILLKEEKSDYFLGSLYDSFASILESLHDSSTAIRYYSSAYEIATGRGDTSERYRLLMKIGNNFLSAGQGERALMNFQKAYGLSEHKINPFIQAELFIGMGKAYMLQDLPDTVSIYADSAQNVLLKNPDLNLEADLLLLRAAMEKEESIIKSNILNAFNLHTRAGNHTVAVRDLAMLIHKFPEPDPVLISNIQSALTNAVALDMKDEEAALRTYLFSWYRKNGQWSEAVKYYEIASNISDSLMRDRYQQRLAFMGVGYEIERYYLHTELKNLQADVAATKSRSKKNSRLMMVGGMMILVLAGAILYFGNKYKN